MSFLSWIFVIALLAGIPIMAWRSARTVEHISRAAIYVNGSLTLWVLAAAAYIVLRIDGDDLSSAFVRAGPAPGAAGMLLWTLALTLFGAGVFALSCAGHRAGLWPVALGHPALAAIVSSAAFGLSHIYQGRAGAARAALIGAALAAPALAAGTILPSMAAHALIDIVCTLWIWPLLDRAGSASTA